MSLKEPLGGKTPTTNLTELWAQLATIFDAMRADAVPLDKAKEFANVAGKMIKLVAVQTEYAHARKEKPDIPAAK